MLSERRQNIEEIREGGNEAAGAVDGRNDAEVAVEIRNFAGDDRPVLLGITERLEYVDALTHVEDLVRYRARGHAMEGNRIRILAERPQSVVEVHPPSVNGVNMAGVTVEYYLPRPLPLPQGEAPVPAGHATRGGTVPPLDCVVKVMPGITCCTRPAGAIRRRIVGRRRKQRSLSVGSR